MGMPSPPPGHLPNSETEPMSPALAGRSFTTQCHLGSPTTHLTAILTTHNPGKNFKNTAVGKNSDPLVPNCLPAGVPKGGMS